MMECTVKFAKVKENAVIPTKRNEDAGFDIYPCIEDDFMVIPAHMTMKIPTGIASACGEDYCFILKERGSTGSRGIALRCGVIDSGYRGEWFISLTNTTDRTIIIYKENSDFAKTITDNDRIIFTYYPYSKAIAQALVVPVPKVAINEVPYEELKEIYSERGTGKLGSSGK